MSVQAWQVSLIVERGLPSAELTNVFTSATTPRKRHRLLPTLLQIHRFPMKGHPFLFLPKNELTSSTRKFCSVFGLLRVTASAWFWLFDPKTCGKTLEETEIMFSHEGPRPWQKRKHESRLVAEFGLLSRERLKTTMMGLCTILPQARRRGLQGACQLEARGVYLG